MICIESNEWLNQPRKYIEIFSVSSVISVKLFESLLLCLFKGSLENPGHSLDLLINLVFNGVNMIFEGTSMPFILFLPANKLLVFLLPCNLFKKFVHHRPVFLDQSRQITHPVP